MVFLSKAHSPDTKNHEFVVGLVGWCENARVGMRKVAKMSSPNPSP